MISVKLYNNTIEATSLNKNLDFPFRSIFTQELNSPTTHFNHIVVVGIGGSDLGTRAIFNALLHPYHNEVNDRKIYFAGDTTDPDQINALFETLNLSDSLFIFVSKSGETIEIKTFFEEVQKRISSNNLNLKDHVWFITDPESGSFKKFANENGIKCFDIPQNIGGRFSVLTNVALVPSNIFNIDTKEILRGAKDLDEYFFNTENDFISEYSNSKLIEYGSGKNVSVMLPYKSSLKEFAKWYQQLWSESLGKDSKGQTPVAMLGPVDQHSQLQLMLDGPNDKFTTIIKVENNSQGDNRLNRILNIEADATLETLTEKNKPVALITIPDLTPYYLGQLFYFFEISVVLFAEGLGVNAFDQPAVEEVKQKINLKLNP
jgi:glucose-6-phosphate isomerase